MPGTQLPSGMVTPLHGRASIGGSRPLSSQSDTSGSSHRCLSSGSPVPFLWLSLPSLWFAPAFPLAPLCLSSGSPCFSSGYPPPFLWVPLLFLWFPSAFPLGPLAFPLVRPCLSSGSPCLSSGSPCLSSGSPCLSSGSPCLSSGSPLPSGLLHHSFASPPSPHASTLPMIFFSANCSCRTEYLLDYKWDIQHFACKCAPC